MNLRLLSLLALVSGCESTPAEPGALLLDSVAEEQVSDEFFTVPVRDDDVIWTDSDITWTAPMGETQRFVSSATGTISPQPSGASKLTTHFADWSEGHPDLDACPSGSGTAVFVRQFGSVRRAFVVGFRYDGTAEAGCMPVWSSTLPEDVFDGAVSAPHHQFAPLSLDSVSVRSRLGGVLPQIRTHGATTP